MAYTKLNWLNKGETGAIPINKDNLNHMDTGISNNDSAIGNLANLNTSVKDNLVNAINSTIVESGTNENGTYIKYDNGIMICFKTITITGVNINGSWGTLYESGAIQLGDFAQTFKERPTVIIEKSAGQGSWLELNDNITTTSAGRCYVVSAVSSTNKSLTFEITAFGKWK